MKQKFSISRSTGGEKIIIKEYAELDKGVFSLLCEEAYEGEAVQAALKKGPACVMALLRTESFFPTSYFAEKLITSLEDYIQQGGSDSVKIDADDFECICRAGKDVPEEDNGGIDVLLEVENEELMDNVEPVKKLDAPIKIAEDETAEINNFL